MLGHAERWWAGAALDLRHAFRGLRRHPGGALAAVLILALGMGSATLVASLARVVLLDPLPYPEPDRLVEIVERHQGRERGASPAGYLDWRRELATLTDLAAFRPATVVLDAGGRLLREDAGVVSGNFFRTMAVDALLGRTFDPALILDGGPREVVLGHGFWVDRLGGRADVLGSELTIEGTDHTVVGVMPAGFAFPEDVRLWMRAPHDVPPAGDLGAAVVGLRDAWYFEAVGRLAPGVSLDAARRDADRLSQVLRQRHPEDAPDQGLVLTGLKEATVADGRTFVLLLLAAVGLVLAATCANVAALTLIRSLRERRELTVRAALGSSGWRTARLVILRTVLVVGAGGLLGAGLATLGFPVLRTWLPASVPRVDELRADVDVLLVTAAVIVLATLVCAALPARAAARIRGRPMETRAVGQGGRGSAAVVAMEVALAVVLLSSTVLLARSVAALGDVDPGFRPDGLATVRVDVAGLEARPVGVQRDEWRRLVERVGALPGVDAVGLAAEDPVSLGMRATLRTEGPTGFSEGPDAAWRPITPGWLRAAGTPLLVGRGFDSGDTEATDDVAVVDEALVRAAFGEGVDPLGRRVTIGLDGHDRPLTIVGVVASTRNQGADRAPFPVIYRPLAQVSRPPLSWTMGARVRVGAEALTVSRLRDALGTAGAGVLVHGEATGEQLLGRHGGDRRFLLQLLAAFAGLSLALGAVGVYAVAAGLVSDRTRELGVRRAIGADATTVVTEVLRKGAMPVVGGLVAGLAGAGVAGHALGGLLYGVSPVDPVTLVVVAAALALTALAALMGPAVRAARVDPMVALRRD